MTSFPFRAALAILLAVFATAPQASAQTAPGQSAGSAAAPAEHPLKAAIRLASQSRDAASEMKDYRATFTKQELVGGKMYASEMQMKFRKEPFSVYLRFVNPDHAGREVLYVDGRNENKMLAHDTGLKAIVGTVAIDPQSPTALAEARYPVTRIGVENLVTGVITMWEKESAFGECNVKYYPEAKLGDKPVIVIESSHPVRRKEFRFAMTRLWLDKQTRLPCRVQQYDFPPVPGAQPALVEDYTYTNVEPNVRLTDTDFDARNPQYRF
jgi:outer membrane lipoprotein-sorting protein